MFAFFSERRKSILVVFWVCLLSVLMAGRVVAGEDPPAPVKVFILMGQSNMLGFGTTLGTASNTLEHAVKELGLYPYLVDAGGHWVTRSDVRNVRVMYSNGMQVHKNEWMTIDSANIGPEIGIGHQIGNASDAPVLILKSCIGNRSLGWDLLPPGTPPYEYNGTMYPGYWGTGENPEGTGEKPESGWYAGKQYDDDVDSAKQVLANLATYFPGATDYEVMGFFWWQGDKDRGNAGHSHYYETNLVNLIHALRSDFNAPNATFVCATLGQTTMTTGGNEGKIRDAKLHVADSDKYPEFAGKVATVYANPLSLGGASNSHYNRHAQTYMNVGEAMGWAYLQLLDEDPPSPDPLGFVMGPTPVDESTIGMVALRAEDVSGPVEYYFENTTNGDTRDWSVERIWFNTGLVSGVTNGYRVKARDAGLRETQWSAILTAAAGPDVTAPTPDPLPFAETPFAQDRFSVVMKATPAQDISGVMYFFEAVGTGGTDSGWLSSVTYTNSGLADGRSYTYRVRARDAAGNVTGWSAPATVTTPTNVAPVATGQNLFTRYTTPVEVVLAAMDAEGDPLAYILDSLPTQGDLAGTPPHLVYTPAADASGEDGFTFSVDDGLARSAPVMVRITVQDNPAHWNTLPFRETFELMLPGDPHGQRGWYATNVLVQSDMTFGNSAQAAQLLTPGSLLEKIVDSEPERVWIDLRIRAEVGARVPQPPVGSTAVWYVHTNRQVMVFDGTVPVASPFRLPAEAVWARFSMHLDYSQASWRLYYNGVEAGPFGFFDSTVSSHSSFAIQGDRTTFVDNIGITTNPPPGLSGSARENLLEHALNGVMPVLRMEDGGIRYVHLQRTGAGSTYRLQTRTNLLEGDWENTGFLVSNTNNAAGAFDEVIYQLPEATGSQRYMRLQLVEEP